MTSPHGQAVGDHTTRDRHWLTSPLTTRDRHWLTSPHTTQDRHWLTIPLSTRDRHWLTSPLTARDRLHVTTARDDLLREAVTLGVITAGVVRLAPLSAVGALSSTGQSAQHAFVTYIRVARAGALVATAQTNVTPLPAASLWGLCKTKSSI